MSSQQPDDVIRTYVDSSVLLSVIRGPDFLSERALDILRQPNRVFLTSDIVRLEVLPKAIFHRQDEEIAFYTLFFDNADATILTAPSLVSAAFGHATRWNLNGMDALHIAAAIELAADELVTAERQTSPLVQVHTSTLRVTSIRDAQSN